MRIGRVRIRNFRSIRELEMELGDMTVFIGPNNAGKTALLDAVRIVLHRRWGQRGTGFTENDVHRPDEHGDPKTLPPVQIEIVLEEPAAGAWDADMVAQLDDIMTFLPDGRSVLTLRVTCAWSEEKEAFDPTWEFLDGGGVPLTGKSQRATNLTGFFSYLPFFWLPALRDAADEFTPRATHWGRLLRAVRIPDELEAEALGVLRDLDAKIMAADPRLAELADIIGGATHVAINESPGSARLNALPLTVEDILQRAGLVFRNADQRPWLPLAHHGQGLQSVAVIFLFQAAVLQQLREAGRPGMEAIFAIEEPEVHLHPQAARALWGRVLALPGQTLLTTHSPYFVQHVPLHDLRLVRLTDGCTEVSSIPHRVLSDLSWTTEVEQFVQHNTGAGVFVNEGGRVAAVSSFTKDIADKLMHCYRKDADAVAKASVVETLHHASRVLISREEEEALGFHGRRVRGEIFFARRWILVEGPCDHMLMHALGKTFAWSLDSHGVAVIDFQQSGHSCGIFAALAEALRIPWHMIIDGDVGGADFRKGLLRRGFKESDLVGHVDSLTAPNDLEGQLLADGHEPILREILAEIRGNDMRTCPLEQVRSCLGNEKTSYMGRLARRVADNATLAARMPAPFVRLITGLRDGTI
jgi:putative ATP-dependent endonuclease of OLD family